MSTYSFVAGLLFGVPLGIGVVYLATHSEFRTALFSKLHSTVDAVHAKITALVQKKGV